MSSNEDRAEIRLTRAHLLRHLPRGAGSQGQEAVLVDVAQDLLLRELHRVGLMHDLVFKGGTALRKLYAGSAGRFSLDLDFCVRGAVGQNEADDIAAVGGYRNAPGLEGKYFFRSRQQAEQYGQMMNKAPGFGAPNYLTSGSIPTRLLGSAEGMEAGSEGPGLFFRNDPSSFFNVFNHGLIP